MSVRAIYGEAVHVWHDRQIHRARDLGKTLCGKTWIATIVGPPATDMPPCPRCEYQMGLRRMWVTARTGEGGRQ